MKLGDPGWIRASDGDPWDDELAARLLGTRLLVGITHQDRQGRFCGRTQVFGIVTVADPDMGICIVQEDGSDFWLPPHISTIDPAEPGEYRNRTNGTVVHDPDYLTTCTHTSPDNRAFGTSTI